MSLLATLERDTGTPPPPICQMLEGGDDKCADCPVRDVLQENLEYLNEFEESSNFSKKLMVFLAELIGLHLPNKAKREEMDNTLMVTHMGGCDGPSTDTERWRFRLLGGRVLRFGRKVVRCENPNVPYLDRQIYFDEIDDDSDDSDNEGLDDQSDPITSY